MLDRVTVLRLAVASPTRSRVVLLGHLAAEALGINLPVIDDLFTLRAISLIILQKTSEKERVALCDTLSTRLNFLRITAK